MKDDTLIILVVVGAGAAYLMGYIPNTTPYNDRLAKQQASNAQAAKPAVNTGSNSSQLLGSVVSTALPVVGHLVDKWIDSSGSKKSGAIVADNSGAVAPGNVNKVGVGADFSTFA